MIGREVLKVNMRTSHLCRKYFLVLMMIFAINIFFSGKLFYVYANENDKPGSPVSDEMTIENGQIETASLDDAQKIRRDIEAREAELKSRMEIIRHKYQTNSKSKASSNNQMILRPNTMEVRTFQDLDNIVNDPDANYIQMADIDLSSHSNWGGITGAFTGTYDGNGYKIIGFNTTEPVTNENDLYGLFQFIDGGTIKNVILENVNISSISSSGNDECNIGALCGGADGAVIDNCHISGTINGGYAGGLMGFVRQSIVSNCSVSGTVSGKSASGFIDLVSGGNIVNCSSSCSVSGRMAAGFAEWISSEAVINKCYSAGNMTCQTMMLDINIYVGEYGGFVSHLYGAVTINDCYSTVSIVDNTPADLDPLRNARGLGGFLGYGFQYSASECPLLQHCYSTGTVPLNSNSRYYRGFASNGYHDYDSPHSTAQIDSCYYDSQTSGHSDNDGHGIPKTTAEMKTQATFAGWDFDNTWAIDPAINNGYPYLQRTSTVLSSKEHLGKRPYCSYGNSSVNLCTGNYIQEVTDINIPGVGPELEFTRFYNSLDDYEGPQGKGWTNNYNVHLTINQDNSISVAYADGHVYKFTSSGSGFTAPAGCYETLTGATGGYTLSFKDHTQYLFDTSGKLLNITDQNNNTIELTYNGDRLATATNQTTGKTLNFTYDSGSRLASITDPAGRSVHYTYDANENLAAAQDLNGGITTYQYDSHGLTSIIRPDSTTALTHSYDDENRVIQQVDGKSNTWQYAYNNFQTNLSGPLGDVTTCTYDHKFRCTAVKDPLNGDTAFDYDKNNNCISISDPKDNSKFFEYDANGNLTLSTDAFGDTEYEYDAGNNLTQITDPGGRITSLSYDGNNNLVSFTDATGAVTSYEYFSNGLLQTQTNPATEAGTGTVSRTYTNGLPHTVTNPAGLTTTYAYDSAGRVTGATDSAGKTTNYTYDAAGNLLSITDPLNHAWSYQYDSNNRVTRKTDANNNTTQYAYDSNGNCIQVTDALSHTTTYAYDSENQLVGITNPRGKTTAYAYDLNGRLTSITDSLGNTSSFNYDEVGNVTGRQDALGNTVASYTYDPQKYLLTSVKDALDNSTNNQYDSLGRLSAITDPLNRSTQFSYDNLNRHIQTVDALQGQASQEFNAMGNRKAMVDANNNRRGFSFDLAGRLTGSSSDTGSHSYTYNQAGLLSGFTNGRGQNRTWQYDDARRLISQNDPDGSISCTYDGNGNLLTVSDASGTITRQYDALNRVVSYTDARGNTIGYTYDEAGNLSTITYPGGKQVQYTYDAADKLTQVRDWAGRITTYAYDANGRLTGTHRPDGTVETRTYNEAGRLTRIKDVAPGGSTLTQFDFTYDAAGNITDEFSNLPDPANTGDNSVITCTTDNRMATYNGQAVAYDADGNMTLGPLNGEMTQYTFNSRNRLTGAGSSSYTYDAEGNRTGATINGVHYDDIINPQASLSQVLIRNGSDSSQTFYVYGLGLIGEESQNTYQVYHYDLRGSTVLLTDASGNTTDSFLYNEYGKLTDHVGSSNTPFLYNGQYGIMTDGTGLCYMRARYYNPEVQRFVSKDSLNGAITNPLSLNLFAYCNNNPINFIDPTGHSPTNYAGAYQRYKDMDYESLNEIYIGLSNSIRNEEAIANGSNYSLYEQFKAEANLMLFNSDFKIINELLIIKGDYYSQEEKEIANQRILDLKKQEFDEQYEIAMGIAGGGPVGKASLQIFKSNKIANQIAQKLGYQGAEDLKKAFVGKGNISKFNIKYNKDTGEIVLESIRDSSIQVPTGLYKD